MSYLTTRDVQDLIRVDKSTIYRMAEAGTIPAIKVGRQWRFPEEAVMSWLGAAEPHPEEALKASPGLADLVSQPVAQAIADLAADVTGVMVVITDMEGEPLTEVANQCGLFRAVAAHRPVLGQCVEMWRHYGRMPDLVPRFDTSDFGFLCARAFARSGSELLGMVIAGGVAPAGWPPDGARIASIAATFDVPADLVAEHIEEVYRLTQEQRGHVLALLPRIGVLISEFAAERGRLANTSAGLAERRSA